MSLLKPLKEGILWPNHNEVTKPPPDLTKDYLEYEDVGIIKRKNPKQKKMSTW